MTNPPDTIDHEGHRYVRWDIMANIIADSVSRVLKDTFALHPKYSDDALPNLTTKPKQARKAAKNET